MRFPIVASGEIDHLPGFSVDPPGAMVLRHHWNAEEEWWTVRLAAPELTFSQQMLEALATGENPNGGVEYSCMRLERGPMAHNMAECRLDGPCYAGWFLHIDARDQHLVYRIGGYIKHAESWWGRWPD